MGLCVVWSAWLWHRSLAVVTWKRLPLPIAEGVTIVCTTKKGWGRHGDAGMPRRRVGCRGNDGCDVVRTRLPEGALSQTFPPTAKWGGVRTGSDQHFAQGIELGQPTFVLCSRGAGAKPRFSTPTTPPTNCWPEAPRPYGGPRQSVKRSDGSPEWGDTKWPPHCYSARVHGVGSQRVDSEPPPYQLPQGDTALAAFSFSINKGAVTIGGNGMADMPSPHERCCLHKCTCEWCAL